jgi:hypothetical protein
MQFYYVVKPCGEVLEYTRESKAQRVASLHGVQVTKPDQLSQAQYEAAQVMYF